MMKESLHAAESKMKSLCDRRGERCEFSPDDDVLALLPLASSPFKATFSGPDTVARKVS